MGQRGGDEVNLTRLGRNYGWPRGLGRIRDIETGPAGLVYLLLEHAAGGRILKLVPHG